jgi:DNA-binding SARP family transcriptional activator/TolB-like protein/Tfp pilus assembly protein PilF
MSGSSLASSPAISPTADGPAFLLRTLGTLDLVGPEGPCRALLAQPKRLALLVHLAMAPEGGFRRRDALLPLFWPEQDATQARTALRQAVRFLRTSLSADAIDARGAEELRVLPGALWHDVAAFRAAAANGAHADALELYRGDFLAGFFIANAGHELDEWLATERASLLRTAIDAVIALAAQHEEADRLDDAVRVVRRGVALDPLDEPLHRQLMILLDALGDRAGALEAYEMLAQRLARELDAAPSLDTRTLRDRIHRRGASTKTSRDATPPAVAPAPPILSLDPRQTIVVLSFAGRDPHEVALGAGMAEMLHAVLHGIPELDLAPIASETLATLVRHDAAARERLAGAALVVDGDVGRTDDGLVVSVRIVDGRDGRVRWRERFARPAREMFALQEAITRAVAGALNVRLATGDAPRLQRPTHDLEAYNLYLRGRWHWTRRPRETRRALEFLERAVARDPLFALAHAAIADCYNTLGSWEASELPAWEAFPRAHAAARKALDLDPRLAEGMTALGYAEMHYTWRRDVAARHLQEAVSLAPTYGHAHHWHSHLLLAGGQVAASLQESEAALACDPLDPVLNVHLAWHHWLAREPEQGIAQCERTLDLHPNDHWSPFFTGLCEIHRGRPDAAVASLRTAVERSGGSSVMTSALAHALAVRGDAGEARTMLAALEAQADARRLLGYEVALVHVALGETDAAFGWLDRAYEERSAWLAYAAVEPRLDPLRGDERFGALMQALRLR